MARISIFHTSDMHNKLTRHLADRLHALKESSPDSLMLDSGDAIWAGNVFWRPGGEPILDLMNSVPYDAICMGNREFHFLEIGVNSKTSRANFPVLSANLRRKRGAERPDSPLLPGEGPGVRFSRRACVAPFVKFERDGLRIAVFGLTVPCITERMLARKISDFYFDQPMAAAAEIVPKLRPECDILIALTHIGIRVDRELAASVEGIDLILGGHTHTITQEPERVGRTFIIHHGFFAHYVGKVNVEARPEGISVTNELIPLAKA